MLEICFKFVNGINWKGTVSWWWLRLWVYYLNYGEIYFGSPRVYLWMICNISWLILMCFQFICYLLRWMRRVYQNFFPLGVRSTMGDIITVSCWWYWDLSFYFFLCSFNRMELLEFCICLMSIEEGVGVIVRLGGRKKYDDKVGRGG